MCILHCFIHVLLFAHFSCKTVVGHLAQGKLERGFRIYTREWRGFFCNLFISAHGRCPEQISVSPKREHACPPLERRWERSEKKRGRCDRGKKVNYKIMPSRKRNRTSWYWSLILPIQCQSQFNPPLIMWVLVPTSENANYYTWIRFGWCYRSSRCGHLCIPYKLGK